MPLRIVQPSDVYTIDHLVGCIYAPPGLRKTTLGFTAEDPLLLDFDQGVHRAAFRRAFVPIASWEDVASMEKSDFEGFKTAVVDTAGRALDKLSADIIRRNPKMGQSSGALTLQGYGQLGVEFSAWLRKLKGFGLDVLLILHSEEQKSGDDLITRIDAQGKSKQEIYKSSDFMGSLTVEADGSIVLNLSPSVAAFGKNPANLPPQKFKKIDPSSTHMAEIFRLTKEKINALTEEQRQVSALLEAWRVRVMEAPDAAALTALVQEVPTDPRVTENAKRVLLSGAKDRGFTFDRERKEFVPQAANGAQKPAQEASGDGKAAETPAAAPAAPEPSQDAKPEPKKAELAKLFEEKFPDEKERRLKFKKVDSDLFFKGKSKGARETVAELSEIDAAIMLNELVTGQYRI